MNNLTMVQTAELLGVTTATISRWKNGNIGFPLPEVVGREYFWRESEIIEWATRNGRAIVSENGDLNDSDWDTPDQLRLKLASEFVVSLEADIDAMKADIDAMKRKLAELKAVIAA